MILEKARTAAVDKLVRDVELAIAMVERSHDLGGPHVPAEILAMQGFGTPAVLRLLNRICQAIPSCRYLEFGSFMGRSLLAAAYRGPTNTGGVFVGVEAFSQFTQHPAREMLPRNLERGRELGAFAIVYEMDWRELKFFGFQKPCAWDVFFYEAGHSMEDTRDPLVKMAPRRADRAGVLVVDYSWPTADAGAAHRLEQ